MVTQYMALFRNRNFLLHWMAGAISNVGDFFNSLALVKILSEDPAHLGFYMSLIMVSKVLPSLLLGPVAGVIADRFSRKTIMIISDLIRALLVLGLVFVQEPAAIIALVFGAAVVAVFYNPASSAMLPSLVKPEELVTAGSLGIMTQRLAMLLGNGIGAAVLILVGAHNVFYIDAVSFLLSALLLIPLVAPPMPAAEGNADGSGTTLSRFVADLKEMLLFLKATPTMRHLMTGLGITGIGDSAITVLPVTFFTVGLGLAAEKMGFIWALFGATSVIGALAIGALGGRIHWKHLFTYGALYVWVLLFLGLLANSVIPSAAAFTLIGLGSGAVNVGLQAAIGELVPDRIRGRVFGVWGMINSLIFILGVTSAGMLSDRFGPGPTLMGYSMSFLATSIYAFFAFRSLSAKAAAGATT